MICALKTVGHAFNVVAIATLLVACATAAQRQYETIVSNDRSALEGLQLCAANVYNSPEFSPLRRHAPIKIIDATLEQLSDDSFATDDEIKAILQIHPKLQWCRQQALDRISQSTPTLSAIMLVMVTKNEDSLIELIRRKETWGQYTRRVRDVSVQGSNVLQAEARRI